MNLQKKKLLYFFCCILILMIFLIVSVLLIYRSSNSKNRIYERKAQEQFKRESKIQEFAQKCDTSKEPKEEELEKGDNEPYISNILELDNRKIFNYNSCLQIQSDLIDSINNFNSLFSVTKKESFISFVKRRKCILPIKDFEEFKKMKKHLKNKRITHGIVLSIEQDEKLKFNHALLNIEFFSNKDKLGNVKIKVDSEIGKLKYQWTI